MADVFASVPRKDQPAKGDCYLRGPMLDGADENAVTTASCPGPLAVLPVKPAVGHVRDERNSLSV
ncbi:hypothetical protein AB5J56_06085 [Streptomyces sp. R21]|uniref:Uncharacterized protein n=1 Tax=Streptomyces sp. R21 TaxID=3238627 RepID=A0AB39PQM3_9ACTN